MQQQFVPLEETPLVALQASTSANASDIQESVEQEVIEDTETETAPLIAQQASNDLLTKAKRKVRNRRLKFLVSSAFVIGMFVLFEITMMSLIFGAHQRSRLIALIPILGCFLVSILAAVTFGLRVLFMPVDFDADELAQAGGIRALPVLLDGLWSVRSGRRKTIYSVLTTLLPQLKATDANLLTARHRKILNKSLYIESLSGSSFGILHEAPVEFTLAILKAYEQVGDATSIPFVLQLAQKKGRGARGTRQDQIREAAQDCLPLLQANTGTVGQNQTLLRAADKNVSTSDILLRPASETAAASDPAQLLRATHTDSDDY